MNSVKYLLVYMELFCDMFGSVLECYELTHISWSSLIPRQDHASLSTPQPALQGVMQEWACIVTPFVIRTLHDCPSQMNENLLISNSKLTSDSELIW